LGGKEKDKGLSRAIERKCRSESPLNWKEKKADAPSIQEEVQVRSVTVWEGEKRKGI